MGQRNRHGRKRFHVAGMMILSAAIIDGISYGNVSSVDDVSSKRDEALAVYPLPASGMQG